jgi:hypothetical protein
LVFGNLSPPISNAFAPTLECVGGIDKHAQIAQRLNFTASAGRSFCPSSDK